MVAFDDGDMLSIPTEKEIFGTNEYGEEESADIKQLECMKQRRNRIAFQGFGTDVWEWYWLANRHKSSASLFAGVGNVGYSGYSIASYSRGVRPLFCIKNL